MKKLHCLFLLILLYCSDTVADITEISVQQLNSNPADYLVVDVRTRAEYDGGHVPGAIHIPYDAITSNPARLSPYRDRIIVTYCARGVRARMALDALEQAGYEKLGHLQGDMPAWREAGLPEQ